MVKQEPSPHATPAPQTSPGASANGNGAASAASTSATNAKDPSRPRRKKARRACFACQRAHLTCGDERPCQRCIKRGLQDACHDGVRKKAKYLHDAPVDDMPAEFAPQPSSTASYPYHSHPMQSSAPDMLPPDGTINPNSIESPGGVMESQAYGNAPLFDPSDPALFNFDIASLNFGSHYGALEFGVLHQMSHGNQTTGGGATPDNSAGSNYGYSPNLGDGYVGFPAPQDPPLSENWHHPRGNNQEGGQFAGTYMIEAGPGSLTSPSPPVESPRAYTSAPSTGPTYTQAEPTTSGSPKFFQPTQARQQHLHHQQQQHNQTQQLAQLQSRRRRAEDPSNIYRDVTAPYPYALQHHRLFHMLESRFPKPLLLRIARAMASFRPSFIACTQTLKAEDLIFMERCFQRTLWEYERFIQSCGTPTIVCRRTGEVVGVGKEFCLLSGWDRAVLLGEKRNLNTNIPTSKREPGQQGMLKPPHPDETDNVRRPVFLAELLDDESVVEFYEEFARLAFGDSRGAVMTTAKVLTYRSPVSVEANGSQMEVKRGEDRGMGSLGGVEGKVHCAFCWTIKRDLFDIPMLIVGNFLPVLNSAPGGPKQELETDTRSVS